MLSRRKNFKHRDRAPNRRLDPSLVTASVGSKGVEHMQLSAKKVLWWAFLAGIGFTVGAGLIHFFGEFLVGVLGLRDVGPWIAAGRP